MRTARVKGLASSVGGDGTVDRLLAEADGLYRYAMARVGDHHACQDLVQETLVVAIRKIADFEARSSLRTWLVGILRHKILDHFREEARRREAKGEQCGEASWAAVDGDLFTRRGAWRLDPNAGLEAVEGDPGRRDAVIAALRACIERLPDRLRRLVVMREIDDRPPDEICRTEGIARGSLSVLLYRARQSLRACVQRKMISK